MSANRHGKLQTQKDGRRYAIALLEQIEQTGDSDETCAYAKWKGLTIRECSQSDDILRAFDRVYHRGTRQAQLGFFVVITDFLASAQHGATDASAYAKWDRQGILQYWRPPAEMRRAA